MLRFVVRRLLLLVPILLGLSILVFAWIRALPGSPAESLLGERATPQLVKQIRHTYGLDRPLYVQYWRYLDATAHLDLGTSISTARTVTFEIKHRFPATVELALAAMLFAIVFGIPLGFLAGSRLLAEGGDLQPRLPGPPGRHSLPRRRLRARQSPRRHLLRDHQPADP